MPTLLSFHLLRQDLPVYFISRNNHARSNRDCYTFQLVDVSRLQLRTPAPTHVFYGGISSHDGIDVDR